MQCTVDNGTLRLTGDITVNTVDRAALGRFCQALDSGIHTLDLSGITRADSACLSLLITARRRYPDATIPAHVPESVRLLAELYDIREWLPL